ncbi:MAG: DUF615 domain-containing protein [Gammaproteobacteria bacterium]|nr:DUF615 domain-containing protein [Gammaproteobacteria bacterium]TVQ49303.1 MAG: DUF615 domain-containing protein [Gammaproteobacteria bacterium]
MSSADKPSEGAEPTERPSKSAAKREAEALQALGESLLGLPAGELAALPLPEELREALALARRIQAHGGLRRQRQLIGKLMRRIDAEPIRAALAAREQAHRAIVALDHQAERWRDRLLEEGDAALGEFIAAHPTTEPQALRQLLRAAARADTARASHARRQLFRELRRLLAADA